MSVSRPGRTFLPDYLIQAHELCLLHHDTLVELLRSAEKNSSFSQKFLFRDDGDKRAYEAAETVFEWLEQTGRQREYTEFLRRTTFPALLSDLLHFVYEALDASRMAKLSVTYALLRKPLQDTLFIVESMALDVDAFANHFKQRPQMLRSQKAGGLDPHVRRIERVLSLLGETDRFDAEYLARLRHDKHAEDSFDGVCNLALHLVTDHDALRTEPLNINFIFSGWDAMLTQWYFLYSRLPYLLFYIRRLFEYVFAAFEQTDPEYLDDIERRIAASTILWWRNVLDDYKSPQIQRFVDATQKRLVAACEAKGFPVPTGPDLLRMRESGAWPGEQSLRVRLREMRYSILELRRRAIARMHQIIEEVDAQTNDAPDDASRRT